MYAIETRGMTKRFADHIAVDRLDLHVPQGSIFGFLGPNGAGKTTTLRMLVGLARPTSGEAFVLGESIAAPDKSYLKRLGYLPDVPGFYDWMRARDFLALAGRIFGLSGYELDRSIGEVLELTGLGAVKTRIGGYSRGMKQRLGMAQALINRPDLVFLDEPTSALDPIGRKEVLEAVGALAGRVTVFFSTHILNDVERVCDTVAIINRGRLVTQQPIEDLRASYTSHCIYIECEDRPDLSTLLAEFVGVGQAVRDGDGWRIQPKDLRAAQSGLPKLIGDQGLSLRRFELIEPSLEDIFVKLVNGE